MSYAMDVIAGNSFRRLITWTEDDGTTPIDLTNCSVSWVLSSEVITYTYENDVFATVSDAAAGEITLFLPAETTRLMRDFGLSVLSYAVTVSFPNDDVVTILYGTFSVDRDVLP